MQKKSNTLSMDQVANRRATKSAKRNYAAGALDRLTADFMGTELSADQLLRNRLQRVRMRSRQLTMDNDYARKFMAMARANIIGPSGIRLQSRAMRDNGTLDTADNALIEAAFSKWGEKNSCTASGMLTWLDVQNQVITAVATDGEVLVRMMPGFGPGGFAIQVIEGDFLDVNHNETLSNGSRIVMGVEIDRFGRPVRYHLTTPNSDHHISSANVKREVVPADQMLHIFIQERPGQNRGLPWMISSIRRLNNIGNYEEYELVASRESASKMGFFTSQDGACPIPEGVDRQDVVTESSPGQFEWLPEGTGFQPYDPNHPVSAFGDFVQATLRGAASGLNVSYNTLANDLEGVNFSSIRSGVLEERENWRMLQNWVIGWLHKPIYDKWLMSVIDSPILPLPARRIDKFRAVKWQPRGWAWVDPKKDIEAEKLAHEMNVTSLSEIASNRGRDLEEVFARIQADKALAEQYDISLEDVESEFDLSGETDDETD